MTTRTNRNAQGLQTLQHTQWQAQSRSASDGALVVKDENYNEICVIREKSDRTYGPLDNQDQARAVLIAAAPELLAALEAIIADAGKTRMSNLDADLPQDAALIQARAAIAKSTGAV